MVVWRVKTVAFAHDDVEDFARLHTICIDASQRGDRSTLLELDRGSGDTGGYSGEECREGLSGDQYHR